MKIGRVDLTTRDVQRVSESPATRTFVAGAGGSFFCGCGWAVRFFAGVGGNDPLTR